MLDFTSVSGEENGLLLNDGNNLITLHKGPTVPAQTELTRASVRPPPSTQKTSVLGQPCQARLLLLIHTGDETHFNKTEQFSLSSNFDSSSPNLSESMMCS